MGRDSVFEPALGMYTRRTGGARYVPDFARSRSDWRLASRFLLVVEPGLPVHARGPVFAGPIEGRLQPVDVHQIGQRSEPHLRRSSRQLGYPLLFRVIRYIESPGIRRMSQQRVHDPDASLPSPGSARAFVPPLHRYYRGTATSCRPSRRTSFPSLGGTTGARRFRSRRRCVRPRRAWGWSPGIPFRALFPWRRQDLPSSWGTPIPVCTCSPTPAGRCVPDQLRDACVAPATGTTKAPTR